MLLLFIEGSDDFARAVSRTAGLVDGVDTVIVSNVEEGAEFLQRGAQPDGIVCDIRLEDHEAWMQLRQMNVFDVPILMWSRQSIGPKIADSAGVDDVVEKSPLGSVRDQLNRIALMIAMRLRMRRLAESTVF